MSDEKHGSNPSDVRATLGPIIFKIAMEQQTIRELFGLLRQVFNILDSEMNQSIPISRARATLAEYELTSGIENKEFQLVTEVPGQMTYREFTSFFAAQLVSTSPSSLSSSTDDIKSDLTDTQRDRLGPVVFRLASRVDEFHRIFKLFRTMFDVFDKGHTGSISKNDLLQLVEQDFLDIKEFENFTRLKTVKADASTFPEFLAFWIHSFVESEEEEESQLRSQLSPIIFKIGLEMTTIGELFTLLQQLYQVFDVKKEGSVDKKDLLVLQEFELLDNETRARLLSTKGNADGRITFPEFATFIAGTFLHKSIHANDVKTPEDEKAATATEEIPVPEHIAKGVPPLLFRLSSRSADLLRVFDLFHKMFDIIDHDHDGLIAKSDLKKLQELDFLDQKQIDEMERWNSNIHSESINLPDFVTFWVAHLVQTTLEQQVANVKISA